jgi:hypothetical protein
MALVREDSSQVQNFFRMIWLRERLRSLQWIWKLDFIHLDCGAAMCVQIAVRPVSRRLVLLKHLLLQKLVLGRHPSRRGVCRVYQSPDYFRVSEFCPLKCY